MAAILTVTVAAMATSTFAQTRSCNSNDGRYQDGYGRYQNESYRDNGQYQDDNGYYTDRNRSTVYNRHRKAINIGLSTGAGALLGALIGGRKGALIGAAAGAGGGAIFTHKQRPRNYYRRY